ncbi:MAG: hypothetical protein IKC46_15720 [Lachnospiraceae bacterium]|nr:hypothetical protein [Lachnospiraceae bacterium]
MKKTEKYLEWFVLPLILFLFPLIKCSQGIDLTDTCYGLVNFTFFPHAAQDWTVATYLANVTGWLLMKLPGGAALLGMRIYTGLFVSFMALLSYFFLKGKMPCGLAFLGEVIAIGLCWIPTTSLYNYLTFVLFLGGSICLYRGLIWKRRRLMAAAGVLLGLSVLTRLPNILECALIVTVFYYGILRDRSWKEIWIDVLYCVGGFLAAFAAGLFVIRLQFGAGAYLQMLTGLSGYQETDATYSPFSMITSILESYASSLVWVCYFLIVAGIGRLMFAVLPGKFEKLKICACAGMFAVLLRFVWGRGMFDFNYQFYWSFYNWGMMLLFAAFALNIWALADPQVFRRDKLLALFVLVILAVTPVGSNNGTYPNLNNLFLAAPVTLWQGYRLYLKLRGRTENFSFRLLLLVILTMVTVQSVGYGIKGVFRDGLEGQERNAQVQNSAALAGMYTNAENAAAIQDVVDYCDQIDVKKQADSGRRLLTMGDVPGFYWMFKMPSALSHDWPDMNTYPAAQMETDLNAIASGNTELPLVIVRTEDPETLEAQEAAKWELLTEWVEANPYEEVLNNGVYRIYDIR